MKRRYAVADLEEAISNIDRELQDQPHGNRTRQGTGPWRPLTFRDHMSGLLEPMKQRGPDTFCEIDLDIYLKFWRDSILSNDPPETVPLAAGRLAKKGRHLIVLPALGRPVFRDAGLHFEPDGIVNDTDYGIIRVCRPARGYRKRRVLGKRVRFHEYGEDVICYGLPSWLHRFIQDQRQEKPLDREAWLVSYLTDELGWPAEQVNHYTRDVDFNQQ